MGSSTTAKPPVTGGATSTHDPVPPDCRGWNFFDADRGLRDLLPLYLDEALHTHLLPHLERLGGLAGGRLDELAATADRHPPVLHPRDRRGRDREWIEYHPAYREMERIAFGELGLHAMSHRGGTLDWPAPLPAAAKYTFQYLFSQAEFGLLCPVSVTDTSIYLIGSFGDESLRRRLLPRMLSQDLDEIWKGTQFITEKAGGSDVGALETVARRDEESWRLHGEKWFCSHADADVALILARPEGSAAGTRGLGLFAMPRHLPSGERNRYRIVRLKEKLGTRSMASGEILLDGALAYPVGDLARGFKQMLEQVNLSRLSHGVRAAGMMRRCLNEALQVARNRRAFGRRLIDMPLVRRRLLDILVPAEQALSLYLFTAATLQQAADGDHAAASLLRLLTPLLKYRACRDNLAVATGSMEMRGGNGYIEDWIHPRLVRDAQIGVLWEGTSNIIALDLLTRAIRKLEAHRHLDEVLRRRLEEAESLPAPMRRRLRQNLGAAVDLAHRTAQETEDETRAGDVTGVLYHVTSAILHATEATTLARREGDARRLLLAQLVLDRRLSPTDPLAPRDDRWEQQIFERLLESSRLSLGEATTALPSNVGRSGT